LVTYSLVIVESPAKAKTIAGYLGDGFRVESSIGHVRDLPMRAADIPASHREVKWAKLGIDVDNDFDPLYIVSRDKKEQITRLRSLLKGADQLYLATDEDREGEAIAWHLLEVLKPKVPVHRMVFNEITSKAITDALSQTRDIDEGLVDAQETRRILDRLYGYELSPVLWKMISKGLSAGRVQSVATRIVVERERERMAFQAAGYWDLKVQVSTGASETFASMLTEVDGARVATGRDFDDDGILNREGAVVLVEEAANSLASGLMGRSLEVRSVEAKPYRRQPAAPFITSTYQQEAGRRLKMSASMAMHAAQGLYQKGYITYMRTDSTTLSDTAVRAARAQVSEKFGGSTCRSPLVLSRRRSGTPRRHTRRSGLRETGSGIQRGGRRTTPFRGPGLRDDLATHACLPDDRCRWRNRPDPCSRSLRWVRCHQDGHVRHQRDGHNPSGISPRVLRRGRRGT
jgi:DNA topoisomerase-1